MKDYTRAQWQAVDVGVLREFLRDGQEQSSLRKLADRAGVGHSTLHNILNGADPHPRVRRTLSLFYLRETGVTPEGEDDGGAAAEAGLETLLAGLSPELRVDVRRSVLQAVERAYRRSNAPLPDWFAMIGGGAARDES